MMRDDPARIRLVDSSGPVEQTRESMLSLVLPLIKQVNREE
jgi:hypothetical protein